MELISARIPKDAKAKLEAIAEAAPNVPRGLTSYPFNDHEAEALPQARRAHLAAIADFDAVGGLLVVAGGLAALGVTHHPLLALGAPAYVVFVLAVRPGLWRDWRCLGRLVFLRLHRRY